MIHRSPKRILMIGGTALLGPHVLRVLTPTAKVFTLTRSGKPVFCETPLQGDRRKPSDLACALETAQPDLIIDMIPFTAEDAAMLCQAAPPQTPLIALSSCDVYRAFGLLHGTEMGAPQPCPISENAGLRQKLGPEGSAYNKTAVEQIYRDHFTHLTILRMPAIYGWPDTTRILPYLDQMLDGADSISLTAHRARFQFCRILHKNAAHAVVLATQATQKEHHIYNVAEEKPHSEHEWLQKIAQHAGWTGKIIITPDDEPIERQHLSVDTTKIRQELGFTEPYNTEEGLADTIAFHAYQRLNKPYEKYY